MVKVKNLDDLRKMRESLQSELNIRENSTHPDKVVQIKVSMATCGIASGAKETMDVIMDEIYKKNIQAVVTQTGCMGYCHSEPTIEVILPGQEPVIYGNVKEKRAKLIIDEYVINGNLVDGIIPTNYTTPKN